jgi:hypothetical protein
MKYVVFLEFEKSILINIELVSFLLNNKKKKNIRLRKENISVLR